MELPKKQKSSKPSTKGIATPSEDQKKEIRECNTAAKRRSRERQKAKDMEMVGELRKNEDRIRALERKTAKLSEELRGKTPRQPSGSSGSHASANRRHQPSPSGTGDSDDGRPAWFGDAF